MAVAIAWLPGPAGTRRRVAKPSVEEPDAAEPARPDLWGARVSNDPGLPDRVQSLPPRRVYLKPVVSHDSAELKNRGISAILRDMVDPMALRWFDVARSAWLHQRETEALASLLQENRTLRAQLDHRPLRLTADQRRRLAVLDRRLGRAYLQEVVTIVTPDRGPAGQDTP